jgi:hypothetical protein
MEERLSQLCRRMIAVVLAIAAQVDAVSVPKFCLTPLILQNQDLV